MGSLGVSPVKILQGVTQTHFYTIFMDGMLLFAHTLMLRVILWILIYLVKSADGLNRK